MPIDESPLYHAEEEAYTEIEPMIYQIAEGRERDEPHKSSFAITHREGGQHRTIFVATAERSLDDYARLAEASRDEGELAHLFEISAVRNGQQTVVDHYAEVGAAREAQSLGRRRCSSDCARPPRGTTASR